MANRDYILYSLPYPVYVNETGTRQDVVLTTFLNDTGTGTSVVGGGNFTVSGQTVYALFGPTTGVSETWAAVTMRTN